MSDRKWTNPYLETAGWTVGYAVPLDTLTLDYWQHPEYPGRLFGPAEAREIQRRRDARLGTERAETAE